MNGLIDGYLGNTSVKASKHLVKDMKVAFVLLLEGDAGLFEQEGRDLSADRSGRVVELDLEVLAEARRGVVANGLGVTEGLHQRVAVDDDALDLLDREASTGRSEDTSECERERLHVKPFHTYTRACMMIISNQ